MTIAALMLFAATPTKACAIRLSLTPSYVTNADIAVVGRVSAYSLSISGGSAAISIVPHVTIRGPSLEEVTFHWTNPTFAIPKEWHLDGVVIIAGRDMSEKAVAAYSRSFPDKSVSLDYAVLQVPCKPPFIFNADTQRTVEAVDLLRRWCGGTHGYLGSSWFLPEGSPCSRLPVKRAGRDCDAPAHAGCR